MSQDSIHLVEDKGQPVKYTVLEKSLIGNEIFEAGQIAEYAGLPSENLAPQCDIGHARYQEYLVSNAARVAKVRDQYAAETGGIDSKAFAAAIALAIAESRAGDDERVAKIVASVLAAQKAAVDGRATKSLA